MGKISDSVSLNTLFTNSTSITKNGDTDQSGINESKKILPKTDADTLKYIRLIEEAKEAAERVLGNVEKLRKEYYGLSQSKKNLDAQYLVDYYDRSCEPLLEEMNLRQNFKKVDIYELNKQKAFETILKHLETKRETSNLLDFETKFEHLAQSCINNRGKHLENSLDIFKKLFRELFDLLEVWKPVYPLIEQDLSKIGESGANTKTLTNFFDELYQSLIANDSMTAFINNLFKTFPGEVLSTSLLEKTYSYDDIQLTRPSVHLSLLENYENAEVTQKYLTYAGKLTRNLGFTERDLNGIYELETEIARIMQNTSAGEYENVQSILPSVSSLKWINVSQIIANTTGPIDETELYGRIDVDYLLELDNLINKYVINSTNFGIFNKYLILSYLMESYSLPVELQKAQDAVCPYMPHCWYKAISVEYCRTVIEQMMPDALDYLYNGTKGQNINMTEVNDVWTRVKSEVLRDIKKSSWLTSELKSNLSEIISNAKFVQSGNESALTPEALAKYGNVTIDPENYIGNYRILSQFKKETEPYKSSLFQSDVVSGTKNIDFDLGILQYPIYRPNDSVTNFAGLGTIVGHELTHLIYDYILTELESNETRPWVSDLDNRTKCIRAKFFDYTKDIKLDRESIEHEYLADNQGLKYGYQAWRASNKVSNNHSSNANKIRDFFAAYAKPYCLIETPMSAKIDNVLSPHMNPRHRVYGTVENFEPFFDIYTCPEKIVYHKICPGIL